MRLVRTTGLGSAARFTSHSIVATCAQARSWCDLQSCPTRRLATKDARGNGRRGRGRSRRVLGKSVRLGSGSISAAPQRSRPVARRQPRDGELGRDRLPSGATRAASRPWQSRSAERSSAPRADDYGTVAAADDLRGGVDACCTPRHVDMYGESYGTFVAQVCALRHPEHLQRLVLDGPVPLDTEISMLDSLPAGLADLRVTCYADPICRASGDPPRCSAGLFRAYGTVLPPGRPPRALTISPS